MSHGISFSIGLTGHENVSFFDCLGEERQI